MLIDVRHMTLTFARQKPTGRFQFVVAVALSPTAVLEVSAGRDRMGVAFKVSTTPAVSNRQNDMNRSTGLAMAPVSSLMAAVGL